MKERERYVLGIDQSTQGTKAVLFDKAGRLKARYDVPHRQIISQEGWVSHDLTQIYQNVIRAAKGVVEKASIHREDIICMGLTNQRETTAAWDRDTGKPLADAIVWQCSRAKDICSRMGEDSREAAYLYEQTGLKLSPYYPAAKMAWLLENVEAVALKAREGRVALGTIDSWVIYQLTGHKSFKTDYSNASRTQLFNIHKLAWDEDICSWFRIPPWALPEVVDSDGMFGETDLEGFLGEKIPICGVLGDSHGALFGHNCRWEGEVKATYGTGSSVMLNVGNHPIASKHGLSTSLAWKIKGEVSYVLEGNINYTGAVISWLKERGVLVQAALATQMAKEAHPEDQTCIVPAFSGLGAPWWNNEARAIMTGMSRSTGKKELVRAACDCIACQISDVVEAMRKDTGLPMEKLSVDGGPTRNTYLMQLQSDLTGAKIRIPDTEELSVIGAAYLAGTTAGLYREEDVYRTLTYQSFQPGMDERCREEKLAIWRKNIEMLL
ncbi:MAG: FGGY-family carbohydrate kinase [Blautia sp.]